MSVSTSTSCRFIRSRAARKPQSAHRTPAIRNPSMNGRAGEGDSTVGNRQPPFPAFSRLITPRVGRRSGLARPCCPSAEGDLVEQPQEREPDEGGEHPEGGPLPRPCEVLLHFFPFRED